MSPNQKRSLALVAAVFLSVAVCYATEIALPSALYPSDAKIRQLQKLHERAEEYILKNDFHSAIHIYDDILLEEPDDETAYTGLGQCYLVLGDYRQAKNAYLNALHINSGNETALLGLKKIEDPDSLNFIEDRTSKTPVSEERENTPAVGPQTLLPEPANANDVHLGAKKTMAPYSTEVPKPIQGLSHPQLIQTALKKAGYYSGPIDGILGPLSRKAVREFQKKYDIRIDGMVGPETWERLQPYLSQNAQS